MKFINDPKLLINPVRDVKLFENPILEKLSMSPWWFIPLFWYPFAFTLLSWSELESTWMTLFVFACGMFAWTLYEYILHRFVFHCEWWLPDCSYIFIFHFFIHGIHHSSL